MKRIKLTLEYDGTAFSGWQVQPGERTVQGVLQECLSRMTGKEVRVVGSGRTDAGVHAAGQVAHADISRDIPAANVMMGLNSSLPGDVRVLHCRFISPSFHAQRSASGKVYRYTIFNSPRPTALERNRVWHIRQALDLDAMSLAAACLVGVKDFAAFKSSGDEGTTVRDLRRLDISGAGSMLHITFEAGGFLKHMVRNITGALVETGLGKLTPEDVHERLLSGSRERAPRKAPPQGLMLLEVKYTSPEPGNVETGLFLDP